MSEQTGALARNLLAIPPLAVVAFYIVLLVLPRALLPALVDQPFVFASALLGWIFWISALVWALALFLVAHKANRMGSGLIARTFFVTAGVLLTAAVFSEMRIESPEQRLDLVHLGTHFSAVLTSAICLGFAASALDTFEGGSGWPLKDSVYNTGVAILFLPIGIWFLRPRVDRLLTQTAQP